MSQEIIKQTVASQDSAAPIIAARHIMRAAGCDAVVLGCTEIPLTINDANAALPTLDSTRMLARAALQRAVGAMPGRS